MRELNWFIKAYNDISKRELFDVYSLRQEVFVVEQECAYQDVDEKDKFSYHLMVYDKELLVAYLRIVNPGVSYVEPSIGRVVTKSAYRGFGLGRKLMEKAIHQVKLLFNKSSIRISAQQYLIPFYESVNFKIIGEAYLEDNIPHIEMLYCE
ncbi:MAG: GNAT family N-acetyltransferase [Flavobacteriales bacterium]|nr:GNAT family N-acetyltransferase [Flavobacteriales bacterium]